MTQTAGRLDHTHRGEEAVLLWSSGSRILALRVNRAAVDAVLEGLIGAQLNTSGRPSVVRQAMEFIESRPDLPPTVSALAAQCHVSVRTLQAAFRSELGISPMAYIREERMRRAHADLRAADPAISSVASIAHRWGFSHLGRFAAAYRTRYGETPSQTLRSPAT